VSITFTSCDKDGDDEKKIEENGYLAGSVWTENSSSGRYRLSVSFNFISGSKGSYVATMTDSPTTSFDFTYVYTHNDKVGAIEASNASKTKYGFSISDDDKTMTVTRSDGTVYYCKRQE
jgi:hypothetical protein